jgi:hypothetical protein
LSICFQADADLNFDIVRAVRQREPAIDFASASDARLQGVGDPDLLERAAIENRILVSHDRRTIPEHFRTRLAAGKSSPGVLIVSQGVAIGDAVDAIILIWSASQAEEWHNQIHHLPSLARHIFTR